MIEISLEYFDISLRLLIAAILGGIIGFEREKHGKDAGFRTHALVCVGSCLMMIISWKIHLLFRASGPVDPSRIAAQVVTGIGFLGAGAIIRFPKGVKGLTTAAGVWAAAGIGLACGLGEYFPAVVTTVITLIILVVFPRISHPSS
ncbi:MAG: MgtC/SapB family protein [Candidatus Omnitrophica bacterium]|nr:MgtC/SapB family protein [Candidatus Omnitrophota bacterium]